MKVKELFEKVMRDVIDRNVLVYFQSINIPTDRDINFGETKELEFTEKLPNVGNPWFDCYQDIKKFCIRELYSKMIDSATGEYDEYKRYVVHGQGSVCDRINRGIMLHRWKTPVDVRYMIDDELVFDMDDKVLLVERGFVRVAYDIKELSIEDDCNCRIKFVLSIEILDPERGVVVTKEEFWEL